MTPNAARIETLTRELRVLDAQRLGLVAELKRLRGHRVVAGSVTCLILTCLRHSSRPLSTSTVLDFIVSKRAELNRRSCMVTIYRAAAQNQIVRHGSGWMLPEAGAARRGDGDA